MGLRLRLEESFSREKKFIFDSGGVEGNGVSVYTEDGNLFAQVGADRQVWKVCRCLILLS